MVSIIGSAISTALFKAGWDLDAGLGKPIDFNNGPHPIQPFEKLAQLLDRSLEEEDWVAQINAAGLSNLLLGHNIS
jgi:hypothetical protein